MPHDVDAAPDGTVVDFFGPAASHAAARKNKVREDRWEYTYGALDLGTNNCRLLIAKPGRQGLRVIDSYSRIVRLGEGLAHSHILSESSQERAIAALKVCAEKLQKKNVRLTRHVATEACRRAKNCPDFVERVLAETGLYLDVISPSEEARLAVLGCQTLLDHTRPYALVFDIGGGSTELILVRLKGRFDVEIIDWVSAPWGVVSLAEIYGGVNVTDAIYHDMYQEIRAYIEPFVHRANLQNLAQNNQLQVLGASGTVTTLAAIHLQLPIYDRLKIDGATLPLPDLRTLCQRVARMTYEERVAEGCVGRDRADLIIPGCAALQAIVDELPTDTLRVASRGLREGILRTLMAQEGFRV